MATTPETDLDKLMATMAPRLCPDVFVFATVAADFDTRPLAPKLVFHEEEGVTVVVREAIAREHQLTAQFRCHMITLEVHSALSAVGFLAALSTALAAENISANAVSAFRHDHLFVPVDDAQRALAVLQRLSQSAS